jgi:hypothetical protein
MRPVLTDKHVGRGVELLTAGRGVELHAVVCVGRLTRPGPTDKPDGLVVTPTSAALADHVLADACCYPETTLQDAVRSVVDVVLHPLVSGSYYRGI